MLELIVVVLVILWFIGGIAIPTAVGLLNLLLVIALVVIVLRLLKGVRY